MLRDLDPDETRTPERIRAHYLLERELASRLKAASRDERRHLYGEVYDELYRQIPDHPRGREGTTKTAAIAAKAAYNMRFLRPFLRTNTVFAEIGAGDCSLSLEAAKIASKVYACDVSEFVLEGAASRNNVEAVVFDGINLPMPDASCDVLYSNQVLEHIHPDDAAEQIREIYRCLRPGGHFLCVTPNALVGPGDVSKYFCEEPEGFHLKEYSNKEMAALLRRAGFSKVHAYFGIRLRYVAPPLWLVIGMETLLSGLPRKVRTRVARNLLVSAFLGIRMAATK